MLDGVSDYFSRGKRHSFSYLGRVLLVNLSVESSQRYNVAKENEISQKVRGVHETIWFSLQNVYYYSIQEQIRVL